MKAFRLFSVAHDLLVTLVRAGKFNPKRIFRFLLLSFCLSFFQSIALADTTHISNSKSGEEADSSNPSNLRPVTDKSIAPTGNQKAQEIKDSAGNLIGLLEGNEIKNSQGEVIGKVVKNDKGEITSTLWNIDKLGNLPESSLLKQKFNALKQDITKLKKEAEQRIGRLNDEIQGADKDAKSVSDELTKLADDWRTAFFTYYTGTLTGLEQSYQAHVRHGNSLRSQKTLEESTLKKVNQLIEDGNLSEAHAVLSGKEQQFKNAMGNIYGQSFRDLKGANQQLAAAVESANRWESGLNTTKNVAVVGGAIIATGGLASFGLVAAAAGGTAAGTAIGAASNYTEASQQVAFGNMTREEAYQRAHERTRQDALTSAQIGISGGVAGTVARGTQGLLGVERATTLSGRLITGATAGGTSGLAGSLLNTGSNLATGNETRTTTQILVDTGAQTLVGATSGVFGAASQYKLDRLATQQSGSNTVTQQLLIRGMGEVVGPTALSTAGTLAAHKLTGREGPTGEELIANAGVNVIGAVTGARVSAQAKQQGIVSNSEPQPTAGNSAQTMSARVVEASSLPRNANPTPVNLQKAAQVAEGLNTSLLPFGTIESVLQNPTVAARLQDAHAISGTSPGALKGKSVLAREALTNALQQRGLSTEDATRIGNQWTTQLIRSGVLGDPSPTQVSMEMSPGLRSYKRENTFQDVPIDAAVKSPNKPFIFEDSQKQRWQITYDPKAKNGYHLNIAPHKRSVAPEMELQRAPASEIQAKLKELAHKPSSELDAVARVREDLAPVYRLSPKHVQGTVDYNNARQKQPGIVPENHVELYRNAIRSETGDYYAKDTHGNVHRFQVTNGEAHWNGATSTNTQRDKLTNPKPIEPKDLPEDIRDMWKLKQ